MAKVINLTKKGEALEFSQDLGFALSTLRNGSYTITIKKVSEHRSLPQNDLLWLWMTCIADETGQAKDDIYMYYCKKFLRKTITVKEGQPEIIYTTSSRLTMDEMRHFLEEIQADASTELGIALPNPEDRFFEQFYQQFNR